MRQYSIGNPLGPIVAPYRPSCGPCDDTRPGPTFAYPRASVARAAAPAPHELVRVALAGVDSGSPSWCHSLALVAPVGVCTSPNSGPVASASGTRGWGRVSGSVHWVGAESDTGSFSAWRALPVGEGTVRPHRGRPEWFGARNAGLPLLIPDAAHQRDGRHAPEDHGDRQRDCPVGKRTRHREGRGQPVRHERADQSTVDGAETAGIGISPAS